MTTLDVQLVPTFEPTSDPSRPGTKGGSYVRRGFPRHPSEKVGWTEGRGSARVRVTVILNLSGVTRGFGLSSAKSSSY